MAELEKYGIWDLSGTIQIYEMTKRSVANLKRIVHSEQFRENDSKTIFLYLRDQMEVVSFGMYLKRYICEKIGILDSAGSFQDVPEEIYLTFLYDSFERNRAPHAFTPVQSHWNTIVKRWLNSGSAERDTVFLLGFGLNMTDEEVSMFLTKVIKEQDFNFYDPVEVAYWHCYHLGLPYARAVKLLKEADASPAEDADPAFWNAVWDRKEVYLSNPQKVREYLVYLKTCHGDRQKTAYETFLNLYDRGLLASRKFLQSVQEDTSGASEIERVLYSGIPKNRNKNLATVNWSILKPQFGKMRLSRQRLGRLLSRQSDVGRFDLLTLLFLDYALEPAALKGQPQEPEKRFSRFIDEANDILRRCDMWEIYPVNPYESFLLMCLLTDDPLCTYNDVWEDAYEG